MTILTYRGTLVVRTCWCGIRHAIPSELSYELDHDSKQRAYCPVGHSYIASIHTDRPETRRADAAERRAFMAEQTARAQRERAEHEERRNRALKGHLTRLKRRIAAGKCPCCSQQFDDVRSHIKAEHAGWAETHQDALESQNTEPA